MRFRRPSLAMIAVLACAGLTACGGGSSPRSNHVPPGTSNGGSEWSPPSGRFAGKRPSLVLMFIHGGGWAGHDPAGFEALQNATDHYTALGYGTMNVEYGAGVGGLSDVDAAYRTARRLGGPGPPICAFGLSAGGNLALLLAARESELDCVVARAAPTDLPALGEDPRFRPTLALAKRNLGAANLRKMSPVEHVADIHARVLLEYAKGDPLVPATQGRIFLRARPRDTKMIVLDQGRFPFVHSGVTPKALQGAVNTESRLFAQVIAAGPQR